MKRNAPAANPVLVMVRYAPLRAMPFAALTHPTKNRGGKYIIPMTNCYDLYGRLAYIVSPYDNVLLWLKLA